MNGFFTAFQIAKYSFAENYRNRFFALFVIFAGVLIYSSLLAGIMAVEQEARVITDFGLSLMELITLAYALMSAASSITREIETKTIYLVLSRPVPRSAYLAGRTAALYGVLAFMLTVMALIHVSLLRFRGFALPPLYLKSVFFMWCQLVIITSSALFVSLVATSAVSTVTIAAVFWTLGHFTSEAKFLVSRSSGVAGPILSAAAYFIPDFQLFNVRDMAPSAPSPASPGFLAFYLLLWVLVPYLFSLLLFRKKEF